MAVKIEMPKLSDTQEQGTLAQWHVKEGDEVESGDVVAEVETDKATMDVEVFDSGTILKILVDEGQSMPLGELMAVIGEEGEDISDMLSEAGGGDSNADEDKNEDDASSEQTKDDSGQESSEEKTADDQGEINKKSTHEASPSATSQSSSVSSKGENGRIKSSPLARKMAEDQGINLRDVQGSGPEGRIIKKDIENYEPSAQPTVQSNREDSEHRVSQMRQTIARRLSESKFSSPHYYETIDIDVEQLFAARKQLNDSIEGKISFSDIIVKACAVALRRHPMVNSSWQGDTILEHGNVHIAFAVAIEEGLITPVVRHVDQKGLEQLSAEGKDLAEQARNRDLDPEQTEGSTFTVSNLGMFGIEQFTAIINPPNACILAVGAIRDVPVVKNDEVVPGKRMKVTLSSDHRIVDGASAADFLQTLQGLLENPLKMLL